MRTKLDENKFPLNYRRLALATLTGGLSMWVLAGLWHTVIMAAFYARETEAAHEGLGIILIAYLVLAALMAYLYPFVNRGGGRVAEGLKLGILVGVLWVFPHELAMAGAHGESLVYVVKNAAWHIAEQGLGGIVIAMMYGRHRLAVTGDGRVPAP